MSGLEPFGSILGGALSGVGLLYLGWSLRNSSIREILFFGIIASASITIFAFNWVIYALWMITGGKFFYSVILFLIYCLLSNLKIVLFLLLSRFLKRFRISFLWLSAALISFLDIFTFQIFPWYFGNLISGNLFLKQSASIFGVFGLSFLSVLLAGIFIRFVSRTKKSIREKNVISLVIFFRRFRPACLNSKSNLFNAILPVVIILCLLVFGLFRLTFRESGTGPVVVVGFIQPDTGKGFRKYASDENFIQVSLNKIFNLSLRALYSGEGNIDLLILPESAVPFHGINPDQENRSRNVYSVTFHGIIAFLTRLGNADVFFNEMNFKEGRLYNLASILRAGEKLPDSYVKHILLPFGEFVPFSNQFPWLRSLFSETGDYVKGRTAKNIRYSYKLKIDPVRIDPVSESQLGILNQPDAILSRPRSPAGQGEGYFVPLICTMESQ
ncbi:MAG: hypothetical protein K8R21_06100 [Leptospira sp.]|nr:hypothetical protein [Leptospira sp.]